MKKILEKLKGLDKKVYIYSGIGLVLVAAIVVALIVGIGGDNGEAPADGTDKVLDTDTVIEDDTDEETVDDTVDTDDVSESDTDDTVETSDDTTEPVTEDTTTQTPVQTQDTTTEPVTNVNPNGVEITGAGSASQPYLEIPTADMTVTTVSVPAGAELYYDIYRVGGMCMTVNDPDAYVICDNLMYEPVNGQIYFLIPSALASDTVSFRIGNTGSQAKSFTLIFTSPAGSYGNPSVVDEISSPMTVSLSEGNETGYYFKHIAKQNGKIRFYASGTEECIILVTNNRNSAQRTSDADALTDEQGNQYIEIDVNQGDELIINVGAMPNKRGKYPALQISWYGIYS